MDNNLKSEICAQTGLESTTPEETRSEFGITGMSPKAKKSVSALSFCENYGKLAHTVSEALKTISVPATRSFLLA